MSETTTQSAKERRLGLATGWTVGLLTAVGVAAIADGVYFVAAVVLVAPVAVLAYELKWSLRARESQ